MRQDVAQLNESTLASIGMDRATIAAFRQITKQVSMVAGAISLPEVAENAQVSQVSLDSLGIAVKALQALGAVLESEQASARAPLSQERALFDELRGQLPNSASLARLLARLDDLEGQFAGITLPLAPSLPPAVAPALLNGWANYGAGVSTAGYYRDPFGIVHLQGTLKSGALSSPAFSLPAGYRPGAVLNFAAVSDNTIGAVSVTASGDVTPYLGSNVYLSLDGMSFRAA